MRFCGVVCFITLNFPYSQLTDIVKAHFPESPPDVVEAAVKRFTQLRRKWRRASRGKTQHQ
jgi:hypothetical protein